jgi:light-harvesting complex I chlorophyll a/b binding protein 3
VAAPRRAACKAADKEPAEETAVATVDRSQDTLWFASDQSLSYLDGTLAGDYGFDPLGLSDPEGAGGFISPQWISYAELIHARFAMLGVAGVATPELLGRWGIIPESTALPWYESGVIEPLSAGFDYWADPYTLFFGQVVLMGFAEFRRWGDYDNPGSLSKQWFLGMEPIFANENGDSKYPGGPMFNMFSLGQTEEGLKTLKDKEISNGRLAMMAMLGVFVQSFVTGTTPVTNLIDHLSDPMHNNILVSFGNIGGSF